MGQDQTRPPVSGNDDRPPVPDPFGENYSAIEAMTALNGHRGHLLHTTESLSNAVLTLIRADDRNAAQQAGASLSMTQAGFRGHLLPADRRVLRNHPAGRRTGPHPRPLQIGGEPVE